MAKVPISDKRKWKVHKSPDEISKRVTGFLAQKGAKFEEASTNMVEATIGSGAKTRFFGGMFVSKDTLPVKVTVVISQVSRGTEVYAVVQDSLGFGSRMGMARKYREYIVSLLDDLEDTLKD